MGGGGLRFAGGKIIIVMFFGLGDWGFTYVDEDIVESLFVFKQESEDVYHSADIIIRGDRVICEEKE